MKITSVNNELIKEASKLLRGKYRDETGLFLLEGVKCVKEAIDSELEVVHIFSTEGFEEYPQRIEVTDAVISKISDAKSAPTVVAVAKQHIHKWSNSYKRVILLEGIKDPGNLGTILRTASAFSVDAVILYGNTVDMYNPKCVRSAVGNLWKIPVIKIKDIRELNGYELVSTLPKGDNVINLRDFKPADKTVIMFGSEAEGLSVELKQIADKSITVEMNNSVESLNLSVSASIVMYEVFN